MHLVVREARDLSEAAAPEDLGLAPADVLFLSFSDSDLATVAAVVERWPGEARPSVRIANLCRLQHPMSNDLLIETTLKGTRAVLVRLLGGLDYWRYGGEQLSRACRAHGIPLAIVPGDARPDLRLAALSTVPSADLEAIEALLDCGGSDNTRAALDGLLARARGEAVSWSAPADVPEFGVYRASKADTTVLGTAAIVFYRSHLSAGDLAPIDALADELEAQGLGVSALFVPSLKAPAAAEWLSRQLAQLSPRVVINATAFAARDGADRSPLEAADCPILQVAMVNGPRLAWDGNPRGLSAADLAMHVVLPELDGRIFTGAISFKDFFDSGTGLGSSLARHVPYSEGIAHVAQRAAAWAGLGATPRSDRKIALVLSTYPGRPDQIAHAVGLDALDSTLAIAERLTADGYQVSGGPKDRRAILAAVDDARAVSWPLQDYARAFECLPSPMRESVLAAWGAPGDDPQACDGAFKFRVARVGNFLIALQPERGDAADRKAQYHDPATPPRHAYIAFYLWLRHVQRIDALVHLGAHGTLEWLPGKAVALSESCAPQALTGNLPVIYPFIVNDPGEAAQAKRRIGAVTLGHKPPPILSGDLSAGLLDVERLVDEFSSADGLDPRRRKALAGQIADAAHRAGIAETCGLTPGLSEAEAVAKIDAFLCDIKELSIRDGLHVLDGDELDALSRALDARFVEPGPSGAPSRGRADVLPTGRNLFGMDPRTLPTRTAWANGQRAAAAILERYVSDHGDWPRAIVLDLWGSATLRTGGEELATALALLGVRPVWDAQSFRVTGVETSPLAELGRPRVDVTLRISGLFRDMFASQLTLYEQAIHLVAGLSEDPTENPLQGETHLDRIFGPASGAFGAGVMSRIDAGDWSDRSELGASYLAASGHVYRNGQSEAAGVEFAARVKATDAFVHLQDHREIDLLTGGDFAAHEGGFVAAAKVSGNSKLAVYHGDTGAPDQPRMRTLDEECARVVHGRAASPKWIAGQMRHGFRGAAEMAATVDAAFAFAATADAVKSSGFERLYAAYLGDPAVAAFIETENPHALDAMRRRFDDAIARGLWHPRRNDMRAAVERTASEAAE